MVESSGFRLLYPSGFNRVPPLDAEALQLHQGQGPVGPQKPSQSDDDVVASTQTPWMHDEPWLS